MKAPAALALAALLAGCAHRLPDTPVDRAAASLQGRFDNAEQAAADPRVPAMTVRWSRIWPERDDGRWFLVEQALAATPDAPYRRRVHRLRADGTSGVIGDVFALPDATAPLAASGPDGLVPQPGCALHLVVARGGFRGATRGRGCPSRVRGATYTTAEVVIHATGFWSSDRGFAADGTQVWGPAHDGPYRFRRVAAR